MKKLFAVFALIIPALVLGATTWTTDTTIPGNVVRSSKASHTTGTEGAPPNPAKAAETITLLNVAAGNTLVITGAGPGYAATDSITFHAHATYNTGAYFAVAGNDAADATNLVAAINRSKLKVTASAVGAAVTITALEYGAAYNGVALGYTGLAGVWTCSGACALAGGVSFSGLNLTGVEGFVVHMQTSGAAMTAGGKAKAYLYNPHLARYAPAPSLDLTVAAEVYQSFTGPAVAPHGWIAYVPVGTGQPGDLFIDGKLR